MDRNTGEVTSRPDQIKLEPKPNMDTCGGNTRHTRRGLDITPPLPSGSSRALTVPSGGRGGVGALEALRTGHRQEHRTGPPEQNDRQGTMAELGALDAMAGRIRGLGLGPLGPAPTFTFTFMHLADAFIQSDLQCIQAIHVFQYVCSLGIEPTTFCAANAMLYH